MWFSVKMRTQIAMPAEIRMSNDYALACMDHVWTVSFRELLVRNALQWFFLEFHRLKFANCTTRIITSVEPCPTFRLKTAKFRQHISFKDHSFQSAHDCKDSHNLSSGIMFR